MATPELSVQLYTVHPQLAEDTPGTLARLASLGVRNVEAFNFLGRAEGLRAACDAAGLRVPSGHAHFLSDEVGTGAHRKAVPPLESILDDAGTLGIDLLIDPRVVPDRWASPALVDDTAERINRAAEAAAERGIRVGYHNHSHEFHHTFGGITAYERFVDQLDPRVVIELDVFWAEVGGQDPRTLVGALGARLVALHVKDGSTDVDPFLTGSLDRTALRQCPAGAGDVHLDDALEAAESLELAVVEFDHFDGDIYAGIQGTLTHLAAKGIS